MLILLSCAASKPQYIQGELYVEDFSTLRPEMELDPIKDNKIIENIKIISNNNLKSNKVELPPVELKGHLKFELDSINKIITERNKIKKYWNGFSIQIFNDRNRNKASEIMNLCKENLPKYEPWLVYHQPNYKIKIGKYFDRLEAQREWNKIKIYFSNALIIPEKHTLD